MGAAVRFPTAENDFDGSRVERVGSVTVRLSESVSASLVDLVGQIDVEYEVH